MIKTSLTRTISCLCLVMTMMIVLQSCAGSPAAGAQTDFSLVPLRSDLQTDAPDESNNSIWDIDSPAPEAPDTEEPDDEPTLSERPENPDEETPPSENPEPENPEPEVPGEEIPGSEEPDTEEPETEAPDIEDPDGEEPEPEEPDAEEPDEEEDIEDESDNDDDYIDIELPAHVQIVSTESALKTALADETTTHIYLAKDIALAAGGYPINNKKTQLIIDGLNPYDENPQIRTLTDFISSAQAQCIYVAANGALSSITVQNIILEGKNFYGPVTIADAVTGMTLLYNNVYYYGPQMTFNRNGTAIYRNCRIEIGKFENSSDANEVGEVQHVILEATVNISQTSSNANETFFIELGPGSITFAENAAVTVSNYDNSGFLNTSRNVDLIFEQGSVFRYDAPHRFWENIAPRDVTLEEHSQVYINISGAAHNTPLRVRGKLTANENSLLHVSYDQPGSFPAIYLGTGGAEFINPKSVLLRTPSFRPIAFDVAADLNITAYQINHWETLGSGSLDDRPLYIWYKEDDSLLTLSGHVSAGASGSFTSVTSNFDPNVDTSAPAAPGNTTLNLPNQRVFAFGNPRLRAFFSVEEDETFTIWGAADPYAAVRAYTGFPGELEPISQETAADGYGEFETESIASLPENTTVYVRSAYHYLYGRKTLTYRRSGLRLQISPENLAFPLTPLSASPQIVDRVTADTRITISDYRGAGSSWKLYASELLPLTPGTADFAYGAVNHTLFYYDESGFPYPLTGDAPLLLYSHETTQDEDIYHAIWDEDTGIKLHIAPGSVRAGIPYSAIILWILADAP